MSIALFRLITLKVAQAFGLYGTKQRKQQSTNYTLVLSDIIVECYIHCEPKKTWQYICDHNSGKTHSIFIIFALL